MSKPEIPGYPPVTRDPEEQVKYFADLYRDRVTERSLENLVARTRELGLQFSRDELVVVAALDTPARVQEFLNTQIYYNNDHASIGQDETAFPPRRVLQTGVAHCFEGAMLAYAVDYLHGHSPRMVLLEAQQDSDHNLVVVQNAQTKLYGCNAHSAFPNLDGRAAQYSTIRALVESFYPYYYRDGTSDPTDLTLQGYSEPFDLVARYGTAWIGADEPLWEIYFTYIDDSHRFHYLFDDSGETHLYPLLHALQERWIQIDAQNKPFISVRDLPPDARPLWEAFWRAFDEKEIRPHGDALEIEKRFLALTRTTPLDLREFAADLRRHLEYGFRLDQILTRRQG